MSDDKAPQGPKRRLDQLLVLFLELILMYPRIDDSGIDEILRKYDITLAELTLLEKYMSLFRAIASDDILEDIRDEDILYYRDICPNCAAAELDVLIKKDDVLLVCPHCLKEFDRG